jgi:hypothetical protein
LAWSFSVDLANEQTITVWKNSYRKVQKEGNQLGAEAKKGGHFAPAFPVRIKGMNGIG